MDNNKFLISSLIVGISLIGIGFYDSGPTYFTRTKDLIQREGVIQKIHIEYEQVSYRGSHSIKSQLIFNFKTDDRTYSIVENIGNDVLNHKFEKIRRALRKPVKSKVWIKESDFEKVNPKVFQISESSGEVLYTIEEAKKVSKHGLLFSIFSAIFIMGISFIKKYVTINKESKYFKLLDKLKLIFLRVAGPLLAIFFGLLFISFFKSDPGINGITILWGLLSVGFAYGSVLFEISLRK